MKFALVDGQRQEARPNLSGQCPACDRVMISKCGEVKVWHWAHKGRRTCDPWWENETEWHRDWKGQFPVSWQEIVQKDDRGEKHIADVKTDRGWVIEFQHSYIRPEERRARDAFYTKLIWVVDGARRKRDSAQLLDAWEGGVPVGVRSHIRRIRADECMLLREWSGSSAPTFLDLGKERPLACLVTTSASGWAYVAPFPRAEFVHIHVGGLTQAAQDFDRFVHDLNGLVTNYESSLRTQASRPTPTQPVQGFQQYLARGSRRRRRL